MKLSSKQLARAGVIAALYAAICFFLKPLSYGAVQFRIAEALCALPIFMPEAIWGLFIGCVISNLSGGSSIAVIDMVLGSLTTLLAAYLTNIIFKRTKNFFISLLPPVLLNGLIVGSYIPFIYSSPGTAASFALIYPSVLSVSISQAVIIYALGFPLCKYLSKTKIFTC